VSKHRTDLVAALERARALAEEVAHGAGDADRARRLAEGLSALWPAPVHACLLTGPGGESLAVRGEAGAASAEWEAALAPELRRWAEGDPGRVTTAAAPALLGPSGQVLHGVPIARGGRRYGALALALPKRAADAPLAQAVLIFLADHLAGLLFLDEQERRGQGRWRDLADLTTLVAHEFNNALNSIGLQVAALGLKGLGAEKVPELAEVRRQVREAGGRVRRLQDFCSQGQPPPGSADLNRAARAAVAARGGEGAAVSLELDPALPAVQGTDLDLERLVGVLLGSAAAEAASGGTAVAVRTGRGPDSSVWLRVEDTAPEPDEELMPRLFEPFAGVRAGGDGGGPALARAIARRLGGTVRAEKRPGGGLIVVVDLREAGEEAGRGRHFG
jgi:signal transduction histidine kinase